MNPRTDCGCQPVAFISSFALAPPGRFSKSRTLAVLLPSRAPAAFVAPLGAFLTGVAFFPDLPFFGATWARRAPAVAFLLAFSSSAVGARAVAVASAFEIIVFLLMAVDYRVTTSITPVGGKCKRNLRTPFDKSSQSSTVTRHAKRL